MLGGNLLQILTGKDDTWKMITRGSLLGLSVNVILFSYKVLKTVVWLTTNVRPILTILLKIILYSI